ncbi:ThuA domain-containing protein [Rhodohalobacter sp. SW132]|uniref:ThuA domain-containing protein n=1 Tax=Rhodohalobacter sp. SW132 TaxID=2293433 RepID=UPI000E25FF5B|nr:ThuA domain-containing protein [Rhodohalobacter sp. SW132]REL38078.1 ThuA domain-containing protein [Rhodohalobacter sp. SW132]
MKKILFGVAGSLILALLSITAHAQSHNVLYVTGGGHHDYEAQEEFLRSELTDRMDISWETDFTAGQDRNDFIIERFNESNWIDGYDAVIYNMCFADVTDNEYIERITQAHYDSGAAAVVLHCAMHTFRDAETEEWDRLIGLDTYYHERQQRSFKIEPINRYHRVMDEFPEVAWVQPVDELYIVTDTYDDLIPLAEAWGPETEEWHPVLWLNTYGNARVVGTAAGHNTGVMEDEVFLNFLVNGLEWAFDK